MLNSCRLLDLRVRGQSDVTGAERREGCSVIYDLVASFKAEKRKVNVGDAWFRVSLLSLSLSFSAGVLVRGPSSAFFWFVSAVEKFVFYIFFLFWSDQIGFSLFLTTKVTDWPKNYFQLFFFNKFNWHLAMRWSYAQKPLFFIWKKVSAPITSGGWMLS